MHESRDEAIVCDVTRTMKYVVRGEKATFHAGDRAEELLAGRRAPGDDPRHAARAASELAFDRNGFVLRRRADRRDRVHRRGRAGALRHAVRSAGPAADRRGQGRQLRPDRAHQRAPARTATTSRRTARMSTTARAPWPISPATCSPTEEAERRLAGRHMLINVWRPIVDGRKRPARAVRRRTVKREDLFDSEVVGGLGDFDRRSLWGFNLA